MDSLLTITEIQVEYLILGKSLQESPMQQDSKSMFHPLRLWTQELFPMRQIGM